MTDILYMKGAEHSDCFGHGVTWKTKDCWVHNIELALNNKRLGTTHKYEVESE